MSDGEGVVDGLIDGTLGNAVAGTHGLMDIGGAAGGAAKGALTTVTEIAMIPPKAFANMLGLKPGPTVAAVLAGAGLAWKQGAFQGAIAQWNAVVAAGAGTGAAGAATSSGVVAASAGAAVPAAPVIAVAGVAVASVAAFAALRKYGPLIGAKGRAKFGSAREGSTPAPTGERGAERRRRRRRGPQGQGPGDARPFGARGPKAARKARRAARSKRFATAAAPESTGRPTLIRRAAPGHRAGLIGRLGTGRGRSRGKGLGKSLGLRR
ncbi:hypothetical protein [Streptodolium elevatio]|uniref:Uncharacterized protein n=1 Tax=Streptodolium elevatio TaxID=3157996 RepID=A0ABV3D9Q6_9ACTN